MSTVDMIEQAKRAGFSGPHLLEAVAVSLAENPTSDPASFNHNRNGTVDRGYWQINSVHGALSTFDPAGNAAAAYRLSHGGTDWSAWSTIGNGRAYAAVPAAATALGLKPGPSADTFVQTAFGGKATPAKSGGNWWDGIAGGAASGFAGGVAGPVGGLLADGLGGAVSSVTGIVTSPVDALKALVKLGGTVVDALIRAATWIGNPHNWVRIIEVIGGTAGLLIGLHLLATSGVGGPVGAVAGAANTAAKKTTHAAGKVAKSATKAAGEAVAA